ncbi:hypothetical protein R1sor_009025 [Riccia sorocarpa]|uniref:Uncharacterized protein n=1 Tax=Riccia sorocarpa TaxID=122646 RepID=A0ABD3H6H7_9MARC
MVYFPKERLRLNFEEDHFDWSQSPFYDQGSSAVAVTSQENDEDSSPQKGHENDRKKEEILPVTRSALVDLTKLQGLRTKLGDDAISVIAMVLTGSLHKDELHVRLKDFIAK